jgi:hypothetical protein
MLRIYYTIKCISNNILLRTVPPIMLISAPCLFIQNSQLVSVPTGKMASWLKGTGIVMPLKIKLIVTVLDPAEQGMDADMDEPG